MCFNISASCETSKLPALSQYWSASCQYYDPMSSDLAHEAMAIAACTESMAASSPCRGHEAGLLSIV